MTPLLSERLVVRQSVGVISTEVLVFPHGGVGDSVVFEAIVRTALRGSADPMRVVAVIPPHADDYDVRQYQAAPHEVWILFSGDLGDLATLMGRVQAEAETRFGKDGPVRTTFFGPPHHAPPVVPGCQWIEPYRYLQHLSRLQVYPRFHIREESRRSIRERLVARGLLPGTLKIIGLHCRSRAHQPEKNLAVSDMVELAALLRTNHEVRILAVGSGDLPHELLAVTDADMEGCLDPSLQTMAAYLESCRLLIGADSGPIHLAAAVGTSVLSIVSPQQGSHWGPFAPPDRVMTYSAHSAPRIGAPLRFSAARVAAMANQRLEERRT
jgi:hypothetical protein